MKDINGRNIIGKELTTDKHWHLKNGYDWPCSDCYMVISKELESKLQKYEADWKSFINHEIDAHYDEQGRYNHFIKYTDLDFGEDRLDRLVEKVIEK